MTDDEEKKLSSLPLEHTWNYFKIHAQQRITLFRYYVIFFSIFATGAAFLLVRFSYETKMHEIAAIVLGSTFFVFTLAFHFFDRRNEQLIGYAEESFIALEDLFPQTYKKAKIFVIEKHDFTNRKNRLGHTCSFTLIFIIGYIIAWLYILTSLFSIYFFSP